MKKLIIFLTAVTIITVFQLSMYAQTKSNLFKNIEENIQINPMKGKFYPQKFYRSDYKGSNPEISLWIGAGFQEILRRAKPTEESGVVLYRSCNVIKPIEDSIIIREFKIKPEDISIALNHIASFLMKQKNGEEGYLSKKGAGIVTYNFFFIKTNSSIFEVAIYWDLYDLRWYVDGWEYEKDISWVRGNRFFARN